MNTAIHPIIIGAGPAGTAASLELSKAGIYHTLIDRASFPRHKVCGESFDGRVYHNLNRIDPSLIAEMRAKGIMVASHRYALTADTGEHLDVHFPTDNAPRLHAKRHDFDHFLLQKAQATGYATVRTETPILKVEKLGDTWHLYSRGDERLYTTRLLLLATGAAPKLRAAITGMADKPKEKQYVFVRTYYKGVRSAVDGERFTQVKFLRKPFPMVLCICPLPNDESNIEFGISQRMWQRYKPDPRSIFEEIIAQHPDIAAQFEHAEHIGPSRPTFMDIKPSRRHFHGEGYLMLGAAAGCVNPATGFGVGLAVMNGYEAGKQAVAAVQARRVDEAFLSDYAERVRKAARNQYIISAYISMITVRPNLQRLAFRMYLKLGLVKRVFSDPKFTNYLFHPTFYLKKLFG